MTVQYYIKYDHKGRRVVFFKNKEIIKGLRILTGKTILKIDDLAGLEYLGINLEPTLPTLEEVRQNAFDMGINI